MSSKSHLKCLFTGWILGWFAAVFLPGLAFVILWRLSLRDAPGAIWEAADAISPWAKLSLGVLLLLCFAGASLSRRAIGAVGALSILGAVLSTLLVLAFLPSSLSAGYGVGLEGERFALPATAIYTVSSALGGALFSAVFKRCQKRQRRNP